MTQGPNAAAAPGKIDLELDKAFAIALRGTLRQATTQAGDIPSGFDVLTLRDLEAKMQAAGWKE